MNKINYQSVLDNTIKKITSENRVPTLIIHSCCAPCSSYVLEYLSQYFKITVLYYNPNIFPREEYEYRISEQEKLIKTMNFVNDVRLIGSDYTPEDFFNAVKGFEKEPEGGRRCELCFEVRLRHTAALAKKMNFDYFTTTLSISPLKNAQVLNELGVSIGQEYGVEYLQSDFKKRNGYKRSVELSKEYGLYRQDYCGCVSSKAERDGLKQDRNIILD